MLDPRPRELDLIVRRLSREVRLLPRLTADNAAEERARLIGEATRGDFNPPRWSYGPEPSTSHLWRCLDAARALCPGVLLGAAYLARLDELEVELALMDALGQPRTVRALSRRLYGGPRSNVPIWGDDGPRTVTLLSAARAVLDTVEDSDEPPAVSAQGAVGELSLCGIMEALARAAGIEIRVQVDPRLAASAAAGDRTVVIADRRFGVREALRLAVHEVLGHLVSAANGRAQPLRLFEAGTAGAFTDQEGLAICLEEHARLLDGRRMRVLAARVVAADRLLSGATFVECVRELMRDYGFEPASAVILAERAYRGGGVTRDVCYLRGFLRVRTALASGAATIDELRLGRVGVDDVPMLRQLLASGVLRGPVYRPSLSRSLRATVVGTSLEMSPPSAETSFTRFEAT